MLPSLLISEIFPPRHGGSSRWFWEIYRRLPRETTVVAAGLDHDGAEFDATHDLNVKRLPLAMNDWGLLSRASLRAYWRAYRQLQRIIVHQRRQTSSMCVVHSARCLPEGWLAWMLSRRYGLPYAVYVHGEDINTYATSRQLKYMVRQVLSRATRVIANSHNTAALLARDWRLPSDRVRVLHPGVDTARFVPAPLDTHFRQHHGWNGRRVILTVGRLQLRKGHDRLIESLAQVRKHIPNVLYAIIGDGEERSRLTQMVGDQGLTQHVQFMGAAGDALLVPAYQQCDLFALPNRTIGHDIEGFGMVLLEAQACGRPVLAGDSGGTRETMDLNKTGVIADCTSPDSLAISLISLLSDTDKLIAMGEAARPWIVSQFDWETLFASATVIFREIETGPYRSRWRPRATNSKSVVATSEST